MELKKVLAGLENLKAKGNLDIDIKGIESDSRKVEKDFMFVAIKGFSSDGHNFIDKAIENGANCIMIEEGADVKGMKIPADVTVVMAPNTRYALAISACNFYQNPSRKFKLIGITGTKGKTTTTFMMKRILEQQGQKVGLIGTIAKYIGDKCLGRFQKDVEDGTARHDPHRFLGITRGAYQTCEVERQRGHEHTA